ncbi:hypothetical protein FH972_021876 [Carpinus fangiana]|uniref:Major facilitator superfamily (MFS) profile domain-containing protein n=1 Tax=Carpinus fangiana TaxID=176857 RepID=A0A5N6KQL0_9ROSI|nr:hypothetical protein FH972_021876 [Carpinus fangiana]
MKGAGRARPMVTPAAEAFSVWSLACIYAAPIGSGRECHDCWSAWIQPGAGMHVRSERQLLLLGAPSLPRFWQGLQGPSDVALRLGSEVAIRHSTSRAYPHSCRVKASLDGAPMLTHTGKEHARRTANSGERRRAQGGAPKSDRRDLTDFDFGWLPAGLPESKLDQQTSISQALLAGILLLNHLASVLQRLPRHNHGIGFLPTPRPLPNPPFQRRPFHVNSFTAPPPQTILPPPTAGDFSAPLRHPATPALDPRRVRERKCLSTPFSHIDSSPITSSMPSFQHGAASAHFQPNTNYGFNRVFEPPSDLTSSYYGGYGTRSAHDLSAMLPDPYNSQKYPSNAHWNTNRFHQGQTGAPSVKHERADERWDHADAQRRYHAYQTDQRKKEEKPVGGVSATLDYEMDQMTDFVTEMAAGMYELSASRICLADIDIARSIKPGSIPPTAFRKWVLQVLNATRLPSATIILSLSYMAKRVRQVSDEGHFLPTERGLYQMLTVSLILGSKFLDDNTFQNKSWAEVSNITTSELNRDEREWLVAFEHRLHHDPHCADGFSSWEERWKTFRSRSSFTSHALHPLDTNVKRQHAAPPPGYSSATFGYKNYSPHTAYSNGPYSAPFAPHDPWYGSRPGLDRSPSTAPHSGPHTPEYYGHEALWAPVEDFTRRTQYAPYAPYPVPAPYPGYSSGYNTPPYQTGWNGMSTHGVTQKSTMALSGVSPKSKRCNFRPTRFNGILLQAYPRHSEAFLARIIWCGIATSALVQHMSSNLFLFMRLKGVVKMPNRAAFDFTGNCFTTAYSIMAVAEAFATPTPPATTTIRSQFPTADLLSPIARRGLLCSTLLFRGIMCVFRLILDIAILLSQHAPAGHDVDLAEVPGLDKLKWLHVNRLYASSACPEEARLYFVTRSWLYTSPHLTPQELRALTLRLTFLRIERCWVYVCKRSPASSVLFRVVFLSVHATYYWCHSSTKFRCPRLTSSMALTPKWYQFLVSVFASLGSWLFGYDLGVIAGVISSGNFLIIFNNPTASQTGAVVALFTGGAFVGAGMAGPTGDWLGRRLTIMIGAIIFILGGALQTGADHINYLYSGRVFAGVGVGFLTMVIPVYQSELAHPSIRGRVTALQQFMLGVGSFCAGWITYGTYTGFPDSSSAQWRVPLGLQILPAVFLAALIMLFPESPRWLIYKGRTAEGIRNLAKLHSHGNEQDPYVLAEYTEITDAIEAEADHALSYKKIVSSRTNLRRLFIAMALQASVQMTGVSAIQFLTILFIDRFGRRKPLILGNLGNMVTFIVATAVLANFPPTSTSTGAHWAFIIMTWLYNFSFSCTVGPLSWIVPAEIFDYSTRSAGVSLATMMSFAFNTLIGQVTPLALEAIGWRYYILFAVCNATNALFFWAILPETKQVPLEEMDALFAEAPLFVPGWKGGKKFVQGRELQGRVEALVDGKGLEIGEGVTHVEKV